MVMKWEGPSLLCLKCVAMPWLEYLLFETRVVGMVAMLAEGGRHILASLILDRNFITPLNS